MFEGASRRSRGKCRGYSPSHAFGLKNADSGRSYFQCRHKDGLEIQDAMYTLMRNKTCLVIAHQLSTKQNADQILVIQDGDIVEQGVHADLIVREGVYSKLYHAQFES